MKEWTIFDEIRRMQRDMDKLYGDFFGNEDLEKEQLLLKGSAKDNPVGLVSKKDFFRTPVIKTNETNEHLFIDVEVPGANKEDVQLNFINNGIEIKVDKKQEEKKGEGKEQTYIKQQNKFYRFFTLPDYVDYENIDADYKNGIVSIKVPKKKKFKKQIPIK